MRKVDITQITVYSVFVIAFLILSITPVRSASLYDVDAVAFWNSPPYLVPVVLIFIALSYGMIYWLQGHGNLKVKIEQDEDKEIAYFTILLSKNANKNLTRIKKKLVKSIKQNKNNKNSYDLQVNHSTYWKSMVIREAEFTKVHVGKYYVYLYGILTDNAGNQIGNYQLVEKSVIKEKGSHELIFDLRRRTCKTDITVYSGSNIAVGAEVILNSQGQSRYIKDNLGTSFDLPVGQHAIIIEYQNEHYTKEIEISDLQQDYAFTFNLPIDSQRG